jgi:predicted  nucleic acid-binding Zn-ribbon protein
VQAQSLKQNNDEQITKALLEEVRLLRQTLQRINLNAYRSQIIVERIRAQNDRVARLSRSLEDTRDEMADVQVLLNQFNERAKAIEKQLQEESDEKRRALMEGEYREMKYLLDTNRQKEQRLRDRETRLSEQVRAEQAKLDDFEGRLDALEREIFDELKKQETESKRGEQTKKQ